MQLLSPLPSVVACLQHRAFSVDDKRRLFFSQLDTQGKVVCALCCGTIHQLQDCEVDHVVPYSLGGRTSLDNAQLAHRWCNRAKGNRIAGPGTL